MIRKSFLFLIISFQATFALAQTQLSTDTSVKVFPHWKKGESHTVLITSSTDDFSHEKTNKYFTTFNAKFSVIEKDSSGYVIEWDYTKATLAPNDVTLENDILANLVDTKLLVKLSLTGRFKALINADEVKMATDKAIDKLLASSENNPMLNVQFKTAKQLVSTTQGLEIALLKHVKFYNLSFGFNYKINYPQLNKMKFPNPLGGQPFDAIEKVQLTKLDNLKNSCVIETTKSMDGAALKNDVIEYLKKISPRDTKDIENDLRNENLEYGESTMQQLDFAKGILQKSNYTRRMNLGFQNRTVVLAIETVD